MAAKGWSQFLDAFNRTGGTDALVNHFNQLHEKQRMEAYAKGVEDTRQRIQGASEPRTNSTPMNYKPDQGLGMTGQSIQQQPMYMPSITPNYETAQSKAKNALGEWFTNNLKVAPERGGEGYAFLKEFMPQAPATPEYKTVGEGQSFLQINPDGTVREVYKNPKTGASESAFGKNITPDYGTGTYKEQRPDGTWRNTGIRIKPEDWGDNSSGTGSNKAPEWEDLSTKLEQTLGAGKFYAQNPNQTGPRGETATNVLAKAKTDLKTIQRTSRDRLIKYFSGNESEKNNEVDKFVGGWWNNLNKAGIDTPEELNAYFQRDDVKQKMDLLPPGLQRGLKIHLESSIYDFNK